MARQGHAYTQTSPLALSLICRARDATYLSLVCDSVPSRMPTPRTSLPSAASSPACATPGAGTPSPWRCRPGTRCPTSLPRRATTSTTATSNAALPSSPGSTTPTKTALPKPVMAPQRQQSPGSRSSESFAWLNSTDPKEEGKPSREDGKLEEDPGSGGGEADPTTGGGEKVAGEGSYYGSSNTIAKGAAVSEAAAAAAKVDLPWPQTGESDESIAESKGGEAEIEGEKESSDVQRLSSVVFASWPAWPMPFVGRAKLMARIFLSPARHGLMGHAHVYCVTEIPNLSNTMNATFIKIIKY